MCVQFFLKFEGKVPVKFLGTGGFSLRMDGRYWYNNSNIKSGILRSSKTHGESEMKVNINQDTQIGSTYIITQSNTQSKWRSFVSSCHFYLPSNHKALSSR